MRIISLKNDNYIGVYELDTSLLKISNAFNLNESNIGTKTDAAAILNTSINQISEQDILRNFKQQNKSAKLESKDELFAAITFGESVTLEYKQRLRQIMEDEDLIDVFSFDKYDIKTLTNIEPMKLNVIDPTRCRIYPAYNLNRVDTMILDGEIDYFIKNGMARFAKQDDVIYHSVPAFIIHRIMRNDKNGI